MGGGGCVHHRDCRRNIFKFGGSETLFLALVMRYVSEKSILHTENGKQLQVTFIKITESKENKSIHRLDVSSSTGPRRAAAHLAPPPPASYSSADSPFSEKRGAQPKKYSPQIRWGQDLLLLQL